MKIKQAILMLFICLLPIFSYADSKKKDTPTQLNKGRIIGALETKLHLKNHSATIIDTRDPLTYSKGHLPAARLITYYPTFYKNGRPKPPSLEHMDSEKLTKNLSAAIVFYSQDTTDWRSYNAAMAAIRAGYKHVLWFRGGIQAWLKSGNMLER